jgi:hypothetical protein
MLGEIWELGEVLFRLRQHSGRFYEANRSARERASWYDPANAQKLFVIPCWEELVWELFKAVLRSSLPFNEKVRCWLLVPGYYRSFVLSDPISSVLAPLVRLTRSRMENRMKQRFKALLGIGEKGSRVQRIHH